MPTLRVIGVGSPNGDDAAGWLVVEAFARRQDARGRGAGAGAVVDTVVLDRPGPALLEHLRGVDAAIVVDALPAEDAPGTVSLLDARDLAGAGPRALSGHALGVGDALALGDALGLLPGPVLVLGVHVSPDAAAAGTAPSEGLRRAVAKIVTRLEALCADLTG